MPLLRRPTTTSATVRHLQYQIRTFINAKVKWVRDPYLDTTIHKEKDLRPLHHYKNIIATQPSKTLPLSTISALPKPPLLHRTSTPTRFFQQYPQIFKIFQPPNMPVPLSHPHIKLTSNALSIHHDETLILNLAHYRRDAATRLLKLIMLTRGNRLPIFIVEKFKYDLGLPHDYLLNLLSEFPDYFQICDMGIRDVNGKTILGLESIYWRDELAMSELEKKAKEEGRKRSSIKFEMNFPNGFDLEKRVKNWVEEWQELPYISPYEDAFHLSWDSDQAEKWTVGVIHEVLSLLVSKRTERENIFCLGEFLGFGSRFKRALLHHPGIFYVSNKNRTQTVVLREAYRKGFLLEKHPLMGIRSKYVNLMNRVLRRGRPIGGGSLRGRKKLDVYPKGNRRKERVLE